MTMKYRKTVSVVGGGGSADPRRPDLPVGTLYSLVADNGSTMDVMLEGDVEKSSSSQQIAFANMGKPLVWDDFNRADSNLAGTDSPSGHTWYDGAEPVGGWGFDRPRVLEISGGTVMTASPTNEGAAFAFITDPALVINTSTSASTTGGGGFMVSTMVSTANQGSLPVGLLLRYIDGDNWMATGVDDRGRNLVIEQCKSGVITTLGSVSFHSGVSDYGFYKLEAAVSWRRDDALNFTVHGQGFGVTTGINVVVNNSDVNWYEAMRDNQNVGLAGGNQMRMSMFAIGTVEQGVQ
jgi:hypothetical protein